MAPLVPKVGLRVTLVKVGLLSAGAHVSRRFVLLPLRSSLYRSTHFLLDLSALQACACVIAVVYLPCVLIGRKLASKSVILCLYFCAFVTYMNLGGTYISTMSS